MNRRFVIADVDGDGRGKGADGGGRTAEMEAGGMIYTRLHPREDSTRKIFDLGAVV